MSNGQAPPAFLFDNNLSPRLAKGMKELGENVSHVLDVYRGIANTPDPQILADAGKGGLTIVSRDLRNRKVPEEVETIRKFKVGGFWLSGKNLTHCEMVQQVVKHWPTMKDLAARTPRPFVFFIRPYGKIEPYRL